MSRKFPKPKAPADLADYIIDFSPALADGDALVNVTDVVIEPEPGEPQPAGSGLTLTLNAAQYSGANAVLWLSGGLAGWTYRIGLSASTSGGRLLRRHVTLKVGEV